MVSKNKQPIEKNRPWILFSSGMLAFFIAVSILPSCRYIPTISLYDSANAYNGYTVFNVWGSNAIQMVDMDGHIVWINDKFIIGLDFEFLEDGTVLLQSPFRLTLLQPPNTIVWQLDTSVWVHHAVIQIPNGHLMFLFYDRFPVQGWDKPFQGDGIMEVDPLTGEIIWEWYTRDHLSTDDYCPWHIEPDYTSYTWGEFYDWTHSNTIVYREEESAVYLNSRHLDRIVKIDYPSGEVLWSLGKGGDFGEGLFYHAHDPQFLDNGHILIFDNGNHRAHSEVSRAVEIAYDPELGWAKEVWAWPKESQFFDGAMGDANRLPNGNTLVTSAHHGKIYEVTPSCDIVWSLYLKPLPGSPGAALYKAERISPLLFSSIPSFP